MKGDLKKLQGVWNITALETDGSTLPETMFSGAQIAIQGDQFESLGMGAVYRGKVVLDEAKKPKHFDIVITEGHAKGMTNYGIYEIKGNTWKLCLDMTGKDRPKTFATKHGSGFALETLKRAPGGAKLASTARPGPAKQETSAKGSKAAKKTGGPVTEIEGEWAMVSGVMDGVAMDNSMVQWVKRSTHGNESTVTAGPQTMLKVEFTYDPSKLPKTIDYVNLAGANKGKSQEGIYEFEGEILKFCLAPPGKPRPKEFASNRGDGRSFTTWKRA
ncbi:MAG TPA: TIGR03067 domain-containing protein [Candidatus Acidoferrum sp.]|nr:TIGR03067 domain-containing protein [Candidatus Acidoferrum sp.]